MQFGRSLKLSLSVLALSATLFSGCKKSEDASAPGAGPAGKKMVVGFSQIGAESGWRTANTDSIKSTAASRGIDLKFSDAQQKQDNQITALHDFIAQGVDVIILAPVVTTGWDPVLRDAKAAHIPVILSDRQIETSDPSLYATYVGSDAVLEGKRAGDAMVKIMDGKANIAEITGTPGSAPAKARADGFREAIKGSPVMKIIMSQTGDFTRAEGKQVMEAFLKSPDGKNINALFAHNDDMALGAIQAIEEAGLKPGVDIKIVSIDGVKGAFEAMAAGKENCVVECNPLDGPQVFDAAADIMAGKTVPKWIKVQEGVFYQSQAAAALPTRKY
jgi:ABC-type sugar transport system substrate-binding protein